MKLEEIPTTPPTPELVVTEAKEVQGLDLLGLRSPAESIAVRLIDGVTTVTPAIRYFSLRAWIISHYLLLGGLNEWPSFKRYAAKVEAAVALGNVLANNGAGGIIGRNGAASLVHNEDGDLPLRPLTKTLAVSMYARSAESLGLGANAGTVPGLTRERGLPLAEAFGLKAQNNPVLAQITLDEEEQRFPRESLLELGQRVSIAEPDEWERRLLTQAIIPTNPRKRELPRIASYCLLLHLCRHQKRSISEMDVFMAASLPTLETIPPELHVTCDGWTQFIVRDLLVLVHEAAVALTVQQLERASTPEKRLPSRAVIAGLASPDLDAALRELGLKGITADRPIRELYEAVMHEIGPSPEVRGLRRWAGGMTELSLIERSHWLASAEGLVLLPVAWILACHRMQPGLDMGVPGCDLEGMAGLSRLGIRAVLMPQVQSWRTSTVSIRETVAWLIQRSVEQHLRIAWSRMAREPHKDVAVLQSDGEDWEYVKGMKPGRATSRLYQAINWLRQLRLTDDQGITAEGAAVLEGGLAVLKKDGGARA